MAANGANYALITSREAARILRVSITTIKRWRREGIGPRHTKIAGGIRYRREDIDTYVAENLRSSTHG